MEKTVYKKYKVSNIIVDLDGLEEDLEREFILFLKESEARETIKHGVIRDQISELIGYIIIACSITLIEERDYIVNSNEDFLYNHEYEKLKVDA